MIDRLRALAPQTAREASLMRQVFRIVKEEYSSHLGDATICDRCVSQSLRLIPDPQETPPVAPALPDPVIVDTWQRQENRRRLFIDGAVFVTGMPSPRSNSYVMSKCSEEAKRRFPIVTKVPRVEPDPHPEFDQKWRCADGVLQFNSSLHIADGWITRRIVAGPSQGCCEPTNERIALWADLLKNPWTEVSE